MELNHLKPIMIDPSLLCKIDFWDAIVYLEPEIFDSLVYPKNLESIKDKDFWDFYGAYLRRRNILSVDGVIAKCKDFFKSFVWRDYYNETPEILSEGFARFRERLEVSHLSISIQNILLDEFVFLATKSSIISRLKKPFKLFEKFDAIPLLNLEKQAPPELKKTIRGIKNVVSVVNWIVTIGGFSIWLGPVIGSIASSAIEGIRLILIDP